MITQILYLTLSLFANIFHKKNKDLQKKRNNYHKCMEKRTEIVYFWRFRWSAAKSKQLKIERWIDFMDMVISIQQDWLLDTQKNTSWNHPDQEIFIVKRKSEVYVIPFVYEPNTDTFFLKTIFPSRKYKKLFLNT